MRLTIGCLSVHGGELAVPECARMAEMGAFLWPGCAPRGGTALLERSWFIPVHPLLRDAE